MPRGRQARSDTGRRYVIMLDSHLLKLIQTRTKYFASMFALARLEHECHDRHWTYKSEAVKKCTHVSKQPSVAEEQIEQEACRLVGMMRNNEGGGKGEPF